MTDRSPPRHKGSARRRRAARGPEGRAWLGRRCGAVAACLLGASAVPAATFSSAHYDPGTNELVVTMIYGGTNPNHQFTVQWGTCHRLGDKGNHQIVADVLDSQWDDAAQQQFTVTVRFSLAGVTCLPAAITLRTAPRYEYNLQVP